MSQYTSSTISNLDSEGFDKGHLYYDDDRVVVAELETHSTIGRYKQGLSSTIFGSTSEVSIPNQDFLSDIYLHLQTPQFPVGAALSSCWAYASIKSLRYQWGSSNVSQIEISGESLFMKNHIDCETKEKRDLMLDLSGTLNLGNDLTQVIPSQTAVIQLPCPWSVLADCEKLPYDTSLLSSNIIIQIVFEDVTAFTMVTTGNPPLPSGFLKAEVLLKQTTLTDKSKSLRNQLKNSNLMVQYPFVHLQTGSTRYLSNILPEQSVTVDLQSFITSDLLGVAFYVIRQSDIKRTGTGFDNAAGRVNKFLTVPCVDIKLEYNGITLHDMPGRLSELVGIGINQGSIKSNYTAASYQAPNIIASGVVQNVYYLPLTQNKSTFFKETYENTPRFAQQTQQLTFTAELPAQDSIVLYTTYIYNGIAATHDGVNTITYA